METGASHLKEMVAEHYLRIIIKIQDNINCDFSCWLSTHPSFNPDF